MKRRSLVDELVRRNLAHDRESAVALLRAGRVTVRGVPARAPRTMVTESDLLRVVPANSVQYVSRGGWKLAGALAVLTREGLVVRGRRCLDLGASTGGFTDVLLKSGAREVIAVDVAYGQLAWPLRQDTRVRVLERTNARSLTPAAIDGKVDVIVTDLSFISVRTVLPALVSCLEDNGDAVPMIKPQFELPGALVGSGGVVREPGLRAKAVADVAYTAEKLGLGVRGVVRSDLPGPKGNVEFFLWLRPGYRSTLDIEDLIRIVSAEPY